MLIFLRRQMGGYPEERYQDRSLKDKVWNLSLYVTAVPGSEKSNWVPKKQDEYLVYVLDVTYCKKNFLRTNRKGKPERAGKLVVGIK